EHVVPITLKCPDWVSVAEMFLATPYLWGGRSCWGIDCSGLVQLSLQAAGRSCPRDSDMQASMASDTLDPASRLERGDLIFWRGHVGIMVDADVILHANGHHMAVISEPLADAVTRIAGNEFGAVTRRARLPGPQSNP
ncbi:MAG: NlpC/P60 family protein, partial [Pseudomonadota bacterium]